MKIKNVKPGVIMLCVCVSVLSIQLQANAQVKQTCEKCLPYYPENEISFTTSTTSKPYSYSVYFARPGIQGQGNCGPDKDWLCEQVQSDAVLADMRHDTYKVPILFYAYKNEYAIYSARATEGLGNCGESLGWDCQQLKQLPAGYRVNGWQCITDMDAIGRMHLLATNPLIYFGMPLPLFMYTYSDGQIFEETQLLPDVVFGAAITTDKKNTVHIAAVCGNNYELIHMYPKDSATEMQGNCGPDNNWRCDVIMQPPVNSAIFQAQAITMNRDDRPSITYNLTTGDKRVAGYASYVGARGNCGPWHDWQCDEMVPDGHQLFVAYDILNQPHFIYSAQKGSSFVVGHMHYAKDAYGNCGPDNNWQCDIIETSDKPISLTDTELGTYAVPSAVYSIQENNILTGRVARPVGNGSGNCGPHNSWQCDTLYSPQQSSNLRIDNKLSAGN